MSRRNPAGQTAPGNSKKQAHSNDELAEAEQFEALHEDAAPGLNLKSSPGTKTALRGDTNKPGMFVRFVRFLGSSRKPELDELQDTQTVDGDSQAGNTSALSKYTTFVSEPQQITSRSTTLKLPSQPLGSTMSHEKRKRSTSRTRADPYEIPDDSEPEEASSQLPPKTQRRTVQLAKSPITKPKTTKGHAASSRTHKTTKINIQEGGGMVKGAVEEPAREQINGDGITNLTESEQREPAAKRPRRLQNDLQSQKVPPNHVAVKGFGVTSPEEVDEGISGILLSPSPKKLIRQDLQRVKVPRQQYQNGLEENGPRALNGTMVQLEEDEADSNEEENEDILDEGEGGDNPIDLLILDRMVERAEHVGRRWNKKKEAWSDRKEESAYTGPGQRMDKQLQELTASYDKMQNFKINTQNRAFQKESGNIEKKIVRLTAETESLLNSEFGKGADPEEEKKWLTHLYFATIPQLILALKKGARAHESEGSMETRALQEISNIVDLLHNLASAAVGQPKEVQPKPSSNSTYQISLPTRSNMSDIRSLQETISIELRRREKAKKRAHEERLRPELERQRRELEEIEKAKFRKKREANRRIQAKAWRNLQNRNWSPVWNQILQTDIEKVEGKSSSWPGESSGGKGKGRQESVELGYARTRSIEPRHRSDSSVERISVFPPNNINARVGLQSLSEEDTFAFIDCMRFENAEDRYERAAEQIRRSMDEVFAIARDLQEAMDVEHERGNYNEARDEWTYSVWVE